MGVPVLDAKIKQTVLTTLDIQWRDNVKARIIDAKQSNPYVKRGNKRNIRSQQSIYEFFASQSQLTQQQVDPEF